MDNPVCFDTGFFIFFDSVIFSFDKPPKRYESYNGGA